MKRILLLALLNFSIAISYASTITGTVKDVKGAVLPYASITVKGSSKGAITNSEGKYTITLASGSYTLICQYVGYKKEERSITVDDNSLVVNFELSIQETTMEEVIIKRGEDPAIEIIRETIKKREYYNKQVDSFKVDVYIKGLVRSRLVPDKMMGQKVDKSDMKKSGFDSLGRGILFLSESQTKVSYKRPDDFKYEVVSSRQAGGGYGMSFPFFINFYVNNVQVFTNINPRGFISPIADGAFHYYKFHYEGSFYENDKTIDRIKVTPKRKNEPLFDGYIQIVDGEWRIHSTDLQITKDYQLQLIDTAVIKQIQAPINADIWRTQNQVVYIAANTLGFEWTGYFLNVYSNYNLNPGFTKKTFNRTVMSFDTAFDKKDSSYWNTTRPVPLEPDEKKDFAFKDSLYKAIKDSMFTTSGLDSANGRQQTITPKVLLITGLKRHHYSNKGFLLYELDPLARSVGYNTVEGYVVDLVQTVQYDSRGGKNEYFLSADTRYGFSNGHFNAFGTFGIRPQKNDFGHYLKFSGGKRVSQFNHENPVSLQTNAIATLYYKKNYLKIYENWFGEAEYSSSFLNDVRWKVNATYEDRLPLENTTDYSYRKKDRTFLPNHPYELANIPFNRHQALVASITLAYQPGQRYVEFPFQKVSIGSKYPTFELQYSKGIKDVFGSDVDFDKWRFLVYDNMNFKMGGEFRYRLGIGGFINANSVGIPDFQHFNGNQTIRASEYLNSFQLAPYYRYSNTEKLYGILHAEHHFNGLLTNKIPLFNRLKWNLVAGTNTFYVNRNNYYAEAFVGLENIFKLFRVDFVNAYQAEPGRKYGVRIGLGGILGDNLKFGKK